MAPTEQIYTTLEILKQYLKNGTKGGKYHNFSNFRILTWKMSLKKANWPENADFATGPEKCHQTAKSWYRLVETYPEMSSDWFLADGLIEMSLDCVRSWASCSILLWIIWIVSSNDDAMPELHSSRLVSVPMCSCAERNSSRRRLSCQSPSSPLPSDASAEHSLTAALDPWTITNRNS